MKFNNPAILKENLLRCFFRLSTEKKFFLIDNILFFIEKYDINLSMSETRILFNRQILQHHKVRSLSLSKHQPYNFIREPVIKNIIERLADIKRDFPLALIHGDNGLFTSMYKEYPMVLKKIGTLFHADLTLQQAKCLPAPALCLDEESFPFKDKKLDLIISVLSLHWVNDLPGALLQARRALKPDGLFLAALFSQGTLTELGMSFLQAETKYNKAAGTRIAPFISVQDGAQLLQRAGFALPVGDVESLPVNYKDPKTLIKDLRAMGETNILASPSPPLTPKVFKEAISEYKQKYSNQKQRYTAQFNILYLTGWAPHPQQPKPLKPGSAKKRLADALNVKEYKL